MSFFRCRVLRIRVLSLALLLACALSRPLVAQHAVPGEPGLRARMAEFLQALPAGRAQDTTRRFFPTTGEWTYTRTVHLKNGGTRVERWVIPAAETYRLFGFRSGAVGSPVRESLEISYEGRQKLGLLLDVIMHSPDTWQLVAGNRFVPPFLPTSSPTYVEWRKEGDKWVISAFGDEWFQDAKRLPPHF